jgi:serine/threonine protein kinase
MSKTMWLVSFLRIPLALTIEVTKNHFLFHYVIGRGGFGKVWKIEKKKEKKLFAMKEMHKGRIISKRSVNSVMNEKKFLTQLKHE